MLYGLGISSSNEIDGTDGIRCQMISISPVSAGRPAKHYVGIQRQRDKANLSKNLVLF